MIPGAKPIDYNIERLLHFGIQKGLMNRFDRIPARNALMDIVGLSEPYPLSPKEKIEEELASPTPILAEILEYCCEKGIINDTVTERDLMDARIMGVLMPRASETIGKFYELYMDSPQKATEYFYGLSRHCNYIQTGRIAKNLYWLSPTEFGDMEITINLSKPEKDPREIALAKNAVETDYPKCLLCIENAGFAGNLNHPARQNLRLIPVELNGDEWFFQYSPYVYYNEHCIIINPLHTPMNVNGDAFRRLFAFVEKFPHYFLGSNAGLPVVGGSILSHDHYQGGRHVFPMEKAEVYAHYVHEEFQDLRIGLVKWPMSVMRVSATNKKPDRIIQLCEMVLERWKNYTDESVDVLAYSGSVPHNAVTPIARKNKDGHWEMDFVFRNNRTSPAHPMGIFHPHENLHHIKKENIGLIEVMGLAVLPGRLLGEMEAITSLLTGESPVTSFELEHPLHKHESWIQSLLDRFGTSNAKDAATGILRREVGRVFTEVLSDAGVFKWNRQGQAAIHKFMESCGFVKG